MSYQAYSASIAARVAVILSCCQQHPTTSTASIPNLEWLILNSNKLSNLAVCCCHISSHPHPHHCAAQDLRPLGGLRKLKHLSLLDNTVTKRADYRLYVLSICPHLKVLDFKKVKDQVPGRKQLLF